MGTPHKQLRFQVPVPPAPRAHSHGVVSLEDQRDGTRDQNPRGAGPLRRPGEWRYPGAEVPRRKGRKAGDLPGGISSYVPIIILDIMTSLDAFLMAFGVDDDSLHGARRRTGYVSFHKQQKIGTNEFSTLFGQSRRSASSQTARTASAPTAPRWRGASGTGRRRSG